MKLSSYSRYNMGAANKRKHGSAAATIFLVEDSRVPKSFFVESYGPTPGERKTNAKLKAEKLIESGEWENRLTETSAFRR